MKKCGFLIRAVIENYLSLLVAEKYSLWMQLLCGLSEFSLDQDLFETNISVHVFTKTELGKNEHLYVKTVGTCFLYLIALKGEIQFASGKDQAAT